MVADDVLGLIRNVAVAGLVMAAADYAMQRRRIGKQTRMTKHEVKQENKQTEGDPLVKSAIRVPPARGRPEPDDGRRPRPPTSCSSTRPTSRSRCGTTPSAARRAWSPAAPA